MSELPTDGAGLPSGGAGLLADDAGLPSGGAGLLADEAGLPVGDAVAVWAALGRRGLLRDGSPERLRDILSEVDGRCPVGVALAVCVQLASALPLLRENAGAGGPVAAAYESAAAGDAILALAATEGDGVGSDLMSLGTTAVLDGDRVVLDGGKKWITNAVPADHLLVLARHRPQRHFTSFLWVLVPAGAPGVRVTPVGDGLFPGAGLGDVRLESVVVGADHLIGRPGRGLPAFARRMADERLAGGLWAALMCRRVLAGTYRRLTAGSPALWDNAAVRERFARCLSEAWRIEAACAAFRSDPDPMLAGMLLKVAVADGVDLVLTECVRLTGAEAFADGGLAELRGAAAMFATAGGATGALLAGIGEHARDLLERPVR